MIKSFSVILAAVRLLESVVGDWWMNVNTRGSVYFKQTRGKNNDAFDFETLAHNTIIKTINLVRPGASDVVYVLGSAKGRAVCHLARQAVKKVVGIELSGELCRIAEGNVKTLRKARAPIEIRNMDAALADYSDGTIFFMFNAFGEKTLREVLQSIENSHNIVDRLLTVVYVNAIYTNVINEFNWLSIKYDYKRPGGGSVIIYSNH